MDGVEGVIPGWRWGVDRPVVSQVIALVAAGTSPDFALHHFVACHLKAGLPVVVVRMLQSEGHYKTVAKKLGAAKVEIESSLSFLDAAEYVGAGCPTGGGSESSGEAKESKEAEGSGSTVRKLFWAVREAVSRSGKEGALLAFEDISLLIELLGASAREASAFVHHCRALCRDTKLKPSLVAVTREGDESAWNGELMGSADAIVHVAPLRSGYTRDVHGTLSLSLRSGPGSCPEPAMSALYKVLDSSVKVFR